MGEFGLNEEYSVRDVNASLSTQSGNKENFDFDLSLDEPKFLGIQTTELLLTGYGSLVKSDDTTEHFEFEVPIDLLRVSFHFVDTVTKDGIKTKTIDYKESVFEIDGAKLKVTKSSNTVL